MGHMSHLIEEVALGHQQSNIERKFLFKNGPDSSSQVIFNDIACKSPIPLNSGNFPELLELRRDQDTERTTTQVSN